MSAPLWTAAEATAATGARPTPAAWIASGVSIDSRSVERGDLFVALHGPVHDGHDHVRSALGRGAAAAMVDRVPDGVDAEAPLLMVGDTLEGLAALGRAARSRCGARVIGVTGSVGKTGTKEALRSVLAPQGRTYASAASYNNQWGVPLSLSRMPRDTEYGVFEIGMNHAGEIADLTRMVRPDVAVITTIEAAHTEFFDSVEAIADAKAEIFLGMTGEGTAVLNRDNPHFQRLHEHAAARGIQRILSFGEHPEADARLLSCRTEPLDSMVEASIEGEALGYKVGVPGRHWVLNSLAVLAAAKAAGANLGFAALALADLAGLPGRGRRHVVEIADGRFGLIDESYNASPVAVRAALQVLKAIDPGPGGRRIVVLGDMRELGEQGPALHAALVEPVVEAGVELVFAVGPLMRNLYDQLPDALRGAHRDTAAAMLPVLRAALHDGDVVTVKGSLGTRMADIVKPMLAGPGRDSIGAAPQPPAEA